MLNEANYAFCSLKEIDNKLFKNLNNLRKIDFSNNKIAVIPNDTFNSTVFLLYLNLSHNQISTIDLCFSPLVHLEVLDVSYNRIKRVSKLAFKMNKQLKDLSLKKNLLDSLKSKSFRNLKVLQVLSLEKNRITNLNSALKPLSKLMAINLSYNRIETVFTKTFKFNRSLEALYMSNNLDVVFKAKSFYKLTNLRYLNLNSTYATGSLPSTFWDKNTKLISLGLKKTLYSVSFPVHILNNLSNLTVLNLSYNDLETVKLEPMLIKIVNLKDLNLAGNKIDFLKPQMLSNNGNLEIINLSHNPIKFLSQRFFKSMPKLTHVYMERCHPDCPVDFGVFKYNFYLRELCLSYIHFVRGHPPKTLCTLKYRGENLNLSLKNTLPHFISNFKQNNIKELEVNHVRIEELKYVNFTNYSTLQILNLEHNRIKNYETKVFSGLYNLIQLVLDFNDFKVLNSTMFDTENSMRKLSMRCCKIMKINGRFFTNLERLEYLDFGNNKVEFLEESIFSNLEELKCLKLDTNFLKKLPEMFFLNNLQLEEIDLRWNLITTIPNQCCVHLCMLQRFYHDCHQEYVFGVVDEKIV